MRKVEADKVDVGQRHTSAGICDLDNDEEDDSNEEAEGGEEVEGEACPSGLLDLLL